MHVNETKLMLAGRKTIALCQEFAPDNDAEAGALVGMFLSTAAAIACKLHRLEFSQPQIERFARAAQDAMNAAIENETGRRVR